MYINVYIDVYIFTYVYKLVGELTLNVFSGCSVPALPPDLVFPPHFKKIVVEVKVSGPSHVLELCLGLSKGMLPLRYFHSNKASFPYQSNFVEIIRLSQRCGKIWPPSVLGILPDLKQWCLSVYVNMHKYMHIKRLQNIIVEL